jgi:hypothetical protein
MHRFISRRRRVVAAVAVLALIAAAAAFAAWFAGSLDGSGGGKAAGAQQIGALVLTPTPNAIPAGGLLKPASDGSLAFSVDNPTSGPVTITNVSAGPITASPPCDTSAVSLVPSALVGNVFPPGSSGPYVFPGALHASAAFSEGCQNASLNVVLNGATSGTAP